MQVVYFLFVTVILLYIFVLMGKKKEPAICITIPMHLYPFNVVVSIGHTDKQLDTILRRKGVAAIDDRNMALYGIGSAKYCLWPGDNLSLIRLKALPRSANDYGGLMHEILHVVISVLRVVGMQIEEGQGADEAYTYLMSYLVSRIMHSINKYY